MRIMPGAATGPAAIVRVMAANLRPRNCRTTELDCGLMATAIRLREVTFPQLLAAAA